MNDNEIQELIDDAIHDLREELEGNLDSLQADIEDLTNQVNDTLVKHEEALLAIADHINENFA